jgi:C-terminal processing protease CtpA/Prc
MSVSLIREEIMQDELTFARSAIVNSAKGKIGYIYLPNFMPTSTIPRVTAVRSTSPKRS